MAGRERRRHVGEKAVPFDPAFGLPAAHGFSPDIGRIVGVEAAGDAEDRVGTAFAQQAGGVDELAHALVADDAGGEQHHHRLRQFGGRRIAVEIDAAAANHHVGARANDALRGEQRQVVGILEDGPDVAVAEGETVEGQNQRALQTRRRAVDQKQVSEAGDGVDDGRDTPQAGDEAAVEDRFHRHCVQ